MKEIRILDTNRQLVCFIIYQKILRIFAFSTSLTKKMQSPPKFENGFVCDVAESPSGGIHGSFTPAFPMSILPSCQLGRGSGLCLCHMWRKCVGCPRACHKCVKQLTGTLGMERPSHVYNHTHTRWSLSLSCMTISECTLSCRQIESPGVLSTEDITSTTRGPLPPR